jgi:hypothetical protein
MLAPCQSSRNLEKNNASSIIVFITRNLIWGSKKKIIRFACFCVVPNCKSSEYRQYNRVSFIYSVSMLLVGCGVYCNVRKRTYHLSRDRHLIAVTTTRFGDDPIRGSEPIQWHGAAPPRSWQTKFAIIVLLRRNPIVVIVNPSLMDPKMNAYG